MQPLAFPALYPTGVNHFGTDRPVKMRPTTYIRIRLDSEDPRFQVGRCPSMNKQPCVERVGVIVLCASLGRISRGLDMQLTVHQLFTCG